VLKQVPDLPTKIAARARRELCNRAARTQALRIRTPAPRGFNLLELIVVMAVVMLLAGLLMPSLASIREQANRMICMSNMRQVGTAIDQYATDYRYALPPSEALRDDRPQDLTISRFGTESPHDWDGFGLLYAWGYCETAECYYCPSHHGQHFYDQYASAWRQEKSIPIFTNYHYAGDLDWETGVRRNYLAGEGLVLATDGLRTIDDYNHRIGMNVLAGDVSVRWREDTSQIHDALPVDPEMGEQELDDYRSLWYRIYLTFSSSNGGAATD